MSAPSVDHQMAALSSPIRAYAGDLTNSLMQDVMTSMERRGLRGGMGDSRKLRESLYQIVYACLLRNHMGGP